MEDSSNNITSKTAWDTEIRFRKYVAMICSQKLVLKKQQKKQQKTKQMFFFHLTQKIRFGPDWTELKRIRSVILPHTNELE